MNGNPSTGSGGGTGQGSPANGSNAADKQAGKPQSQASQPGKPVNAESSSDGGFLAPGPDPDRHRRAGGDLDRRGRDQAAAPAPRSRRPGLAEGELARCRKRRCESVGVHVPGRRSLAIALVGLAVFAAAAQAVPARFWGVVPQAGPERRTVPALKRGGVDSIRIPIDWGGGAAGAGRAPSTGRDVDGPVRKAANTGIEVLPFLTGAPTWAVPHVFVPGTGKPRKRPPACRPAGAAAGAWSSFVKAAVARYGPNGTFWAENPIVPKRPIRAWQIWNEENFKYFVAKPNPAEYGKLVKLSSTRAEERRPGREGDPRRHVRAAQGLPLESEAQARLLRPRLPRGDVSRRRRGSSPSSTASPCTPTPALLPGTDARGSKNSAPS